MINTAKKAFKLFYKNNQKYFATDRLLESEDGVVLGCLERVTYHAESVSISGWCTAPKISVWNDSHRIIIQRKTHRGDVVRALGQNKLDELGFLNGRVGFNVEITAPMMGISINIESAGVVYKWPLPYPTLQEHSKAQKRAVIPFVKTCVTMLPVVVTYVAKGRDPEKRKVLLDRLGVNGDRNQNKRIEDDIYVSSRPIQPTGTNRAAITIIMPIYNAFDLLPEALRRIEENTDIAWRLIIIEDASPDTNVRPWVEQWAGDRENVILLLNEKNLGFIGSVNRGFEHALKFDGHVVLFNSDAFVPKLWASRIIAPIINDDKVGSVTPMSNDATIFSVPTMTEVRQVPPGGVDKIDDEASKINPDFFAVAPTGVGFCMALNIEALRKVPSLDTIFGKGYGEEVDWCQRIGALGFRHVGIPNLFVEHRGGQSFGSEAKEKALTASAKIIRDRWPSFDDSVQNFIKDDPLRSTRFILSCAYASAVSSRPIPIYIGHSLGGGAENWLRERLKASRELCHPAIVVRLGGVVRFRIELYLDGEKFVATTDKWDVVCNVIRSASSREIIYSCAVGDSSEVEVPRLLVEFLQSGSAVLNVLFHDFLPISPSYTLLCSDGVYRSSADEMQKDSAHSFNFSDGTKGDVVEWQRQWKYALDHAQSLIVFSNNSADIVLRTWPDLSDKVKVQPHVDFPVTVPYSVIPYQTGGRPSIALLGGIGQHKGAKIVSELAEYIKGKECPYDIVVIGEFDRSYNIPSSVVVHGKYVVAELPELMAKYNVSGWFMASIWPETFSYTTHEMLATGLPVISFGLGAQGDAIAEHDNGMIVDIDIPKIHSALLHASEMGARLIERNAKLFTKAG